METGGEETAEELLAKVPVESRPLVARLLDEPLLPSVVLRGEVDAYLNLYHDAQRGNESLDPEHAEALAARCRRLLDRVGPDAPEAHRRLVQVAVRYFVIEADADDDMGIGGLDDDEVVVTAVEALLSGGPID
jgi:hypothetical protein